MNKEDVLNQIEEILSDYEDYFEDGKFNSPYSRESVFNNVSWILQDYAESKKIEFLGYFRTKFEKSSEMLRIVSHPFLDEQTIKRKLYVFMSAQDDEIVFECLKYVYDKTHDEKLNDEILKREIFDINKWGIIFAKF